MDLSLLMVHQGSTIDQDNKSLVSIISCLSHTESRCVGSSSAVVPVVSVNLALDAKFPVVLKMGICQRELREQ